MGLLLFVAGCGTMGTLTGMSPMGTVTFGVYSGIRKDVEMSRFGDALWLVDIPFSAVADTALLPVTFLLWLFGDGGPSQPDRPPERR